jgi:dTDP-4-amino-4,6-dideoxygalactose transaminase
VIPLVDLHAQHQQVAEEVGAAIERVLASGRYVLGPEVEAFEAELAAFCGIAHCVAVSSGTAALHLALTAAGISGEDEVITSSMTFAATAEAIIHAGARPVLVEVAPESGLIDLDRVAAAITSRTRAILPVHLYGNLVPMDAVLQIAGEQDLVVIEDAAQAVGGRWRGRSAGSLGELGCFSFYPTKTLGAYGEGGAVITNDSHLASSIRLLRDHGQDRKYHHVAVGFNYRLDELQAAILRVKLAHVPAWLEARKTIAARYREQLVRIGMGLTVETPGCDHAHHIFAILHPRRDQLRGWLAERGIETGIHYPVPLHLQPGLADRVEAATALPSTEAFADRTLSLPFYAELPASHVDEIVAAIIEWLALPPPAAEREATA